MPKIILSLLLAVPVSFACADERMPQNSRRGGCQSRVVNRIVDDTAREQRRMLIESYEFDEDRYQTDWDGTYSDGSNARDPEGF